MQKKLIFLSTYVFSYKLQFLFFNYRLLDLTKVRVATAIMHVSDILEVYDEHTIRVSTNKYIKKIEFSKCENNLHENDISFLLCCK